MWEDIKSVSVVLFVLLYWVHSSIHYPAWPQGYTRAAFLSNSSLPCSSGGREGEKEGCYEAKKQVLAEGREEAEPSWPC